MMLAGARRDCQGKKKPALFGGLNPYQRRHGGDSSNYSKTLGATQHENAGNPQLLSSSNSESNGLSDSQPLPPLCRPADSPDGRPP
ncbi:protein of unknown function [Paraburkholderia kururiensis]